jgi:hypothetical protein
MYINVRCMLTSSLHGDHVDAVANDDDDGCCMSLFCLPLPPRSHRVGLFSIFLIKGSLISYSYYSWATNTTTTSFTSTNVTIQSMLSTYTLCDVAEEAFNITDGDLTQEMYEDKAWLSEYQRVCFIPLDGPIPTRGFNYSITLDSSDYSTTSSTATAGASMTVTAASQTSTTTTQSATSTGLTISPNGLCGSSNSDYTCTGSQFGSCCSKYGY